MKVFFDTSVLVASIVAQHGDHARAFAVPERVQNGRDEGVISAQSLAETTQCFMKCVAKENVGRIFTLNLRHFQAVAPRELAEILIAP